MKVVSVVGVRPEFVQSSVVSKALKAKHEEIIIVHTGQHYDYQMNKVFFEQLDISEPNYHLDIGSGSHGYQTGEIIKKIEEVSIKEKPDFVLIYGDTNSTLAGALAASKLHIKIAHVESGLRSFDKSMPEEINRILTDHCSDILFCSTLNAVKNLKNEGITENVYLTGDVMVDSLLYYREIAEKKSNILSELGLRNKEYLVATVHRASNTDDETNLKNIVDAFSELNETIVFPLHPRTEKFLKTYGLYDKLKSSVILTEPMGFFEFVKLMNHARMILTDSGGIQKEAYVLRVPCITLRENTEWIESVEDGWNILVGTDKNKIIKEISSFSPSLNTHSNRFGNGNAGDKIASILQDYLKTQS